MSQQLRNNPMKVALASMVGTAIEFFDYYIYAAAAVLVFNTHFFQSDDRLLVLHYLVTSAIKLVVKKPWLPPLF